MASGIIGTFSAEHTLVAPQDALLKAGKTQVGMEFPVALSLQKAIAQGKEPGEALICN